MPFLEYTDGETGFEGYLAIPSSSARPSSAGPSSAGASSAGPSSARWPCILVGHAWDGPNAYFNAMADELARQGYLAFAIDVYGKGIRGRIDGDNSALMNPLLADRALLRRRLLAALRFICRHPQADPKRVAMLGYCFGGLCALDLARAAPDELVGAIAVHAPLTRAALPSQPIKARLLVLHGWDDPVAPPSDLVEFATEVTEAGATWEVRAYGHAKHAFTFEGANIPELGIAYNTFAARQSQTAIRTFLSEVLPLQ